MKVVSARYIGRLGNNMFQLAAAIGYARMYGYEWRSEQRNDEVPQWHNFWPHLPIGNGGIKSHQYLAPETFNFKRIENIGGCRLMGFFQSEKYFKHCEDEVRDIFKLPITGGITDYCSIHVRRGDYVKYAADFPPIEMPYINKAMDIMRSRGVKKFLVFSDGLDWCKANIKGVEFSEGRNEFNDMALMASCGNHIIANSTFSWWGAWLGINHNKHVISPTHANWFGKNNGVTLKIGAPKDIIPDRWQQIR